MILLLLATLQSAAAAPRMPTTVPTPPPVYIPTPVRSGAAKRYVLDVEVRAGGVLLWSGPLRVGGSYGQTSVRSDQSEPGDANCGTGDAIAPAASSFYLTLNPRGGEDGLAVTVRWSRPGDQPCGPGPNSRTVELSGTVDLAPGVSTTLTGDGGLTVRLRRR